MDGAVQSDPSDRIHPIRFMLLVPQVTVRIIDSSAIQESRPTPHSLAVHYVFTEFLPSFYRVFTEFLPSFIGVYLVLLVFFSGFHRVLPSIT